MKRNRSIISITVILFICLSGLLYVNGHTANKASASNFDRLVLGSGNYGTDPNPTADITYQNGEYVSNAVDGQLDYGSANLITTGTISGKFIGGGWGQFKIITNSANNQSKFDTLTIAGVDTSYRYIATPLKTVVPVAGDLLACGTIAGKLIVSRADTTTANLKYSYVRVK